MPPRSLGTKSRDEKMTEKITSLRSRGMSHSDMRANLKASKDPDEVDTAKGPVNARKAWPAMASKVKANQMAVQAGGEGAPPVDLGRLLRGVIPGLDGLLESDPVAWQPPQREQAQKVVVIILRVDPNFLDGCCCGDEEEGEQEDAPDKGGAKEDRAEAEDDEEKD